MNRGPIEFPKDIEAEVTLLPTQDGGRSTGVTSGYRPQFYYDGHHWDAIHTYPDSDVVNPGETARAYLYLISPQYHVGKLRPGKPFLLYEGRKLIGYGVVTRILNLEQSAKED